MVKSLLQYAAHCALDSGLQCLGRNEAVADTALGPISGCTSAGSGDHRVVQSTGDLSAVLRPGLRHEFLERAPILWRGCSSYQNRFREQYI